MAEAIKTPVTENQQTVTENQQTEAEVNAEKTPTVEELLAQIAEQKAAYEKLKAANDKTSKSEAELKRQLRLKQTADEQADEAKREQEEAHKEYVAGLEEFQKRTLAEKRYVLQGMSAELAAKAAEAEISGDMDELASVHKQHTDTLLREAKAEWVKDANQTNFGVGSGSTMTKEEIMAIKDPAQRRRMIAENITLFE